MNEIQPMQNHGVTPVVEPAVTPVITNHIGEIKTSDDLLVIVSKVSRVLVEQMKTRPGKVTWSLSSTLSCCRSTELPSEKGGNKKKRIACCCTIVVDRSRCRNRGACGHLTKSVHHCGSGNHGLSIRRNPITLSSFSGRIFPA